jgi:hypothetical protein
MCQRIILPAYSFTSPGVQRVLIMLESKSSSGWLSRILPVAAVYCFFKFFIGMDFTVCTRSRTSSSDTVEQVCRICGYILCHILQSRVKDFVNSVTYSALISGKVHPRV